MSDVPTAPLADLCADHDATFHEGSVTFVDVVRRRMETDRGESVPFDAAIIAPGGRARPTLTGALTFDGRRGIVELRRLIARLPDDDVGIIAFAVPGGVSWALPAYELALLTAQQAAGRSRVALVTPASAPLEAFGRAASARVAAPD